MVKPVAGKEKFFSAAAIDVLLMVLVVVGVVIWEGWNVTTKGQYAASWLAVMVMVIIYKALSLLDSYVTKWAVESCRLPDANGTSSS